MTTNTLAEGLQSASVDFGTLHQHYHPALALVRELIGVVPNCDPLLEIWPPGFRTYNLLVPNFFNLPQTLFGKRSFKAAMGLAMYAASRAASCAYCTAHSCSFALRRGATADAIIGRRSPREAAVVALAEALARVPATLTAAEVQEAEKYFRADEVEGLVLAVSVMGFLNKFMNAMGVELEQEALDETGAVLAQTDWRPGYHVRGEYRFTSRGNPPVDSLRTYLRVIRQAPGAVRLEKQWTRGVPNTSGAASMYLEQHTGYNFPLLRLIGRGRIIRTLATVLQDNLNEEQTAVGLPAKMVAGYVFSRFVGNEALQHEIGALAAHVLPGLHRRYALLDKLARTTPPTTDEDCQALMRFGEEQLRLSTSEAAVTLLALAAMPSPAVISKAIIRNSRKHLSPTAIVETIVWLSVLQLLHRLTTFYTLRDA